MKIEQALAQRCESRCELCASDEKLAVYEVPPVSIPDINNCIMVCDQCLGQITSPETMDANHWRCLSTSMWSEVLAIQVVAWRLLKQLSAEGWAQDLLEMLYLDDEAMQWAEAGNSSDDSEPVFDRNGAALSAGDSVTLIKDLEVKGAGFTAKRGTAVRNISLTSNPDQIEGRVNGVRIVLLTRFLKKSN